MRLAEALGIEELLARVRIWWYPFTLRTLSRSVGERLIEWADDADGRPAADPPKVIFKVRKEWEARRPKFEAQVIGDHVVVAVPGLMLKRLFGSHPRFQRAASREAIR